MYGFKYQNFQNWFDPIFVTLLSDLFMKQYTYEHLLISTSIFVTITCCILICLIHEINAVNAIQHFVDEYPDHKSIIFNSIIPFPDRIQKSCWRWHQGNWERTLWLGLASFQMQFSKSRSVYSQSFVGKSTSGLSAEQWFK